MFSLSDSQLAALLDEIANAIRAGTPLDQSMRRLASRRLGRVGRSAEKVAQKLEQGEKLSMSMEALRGSSSTALIEMVRVAEESGKPNMLNRFASQLRCRSQFSQSVFLAWLYPFTLCIVAYVSAVFFLFPMVLQFEKEPDFAWPSSVIALSKWTMDHPWGLPILFAVLVVTLITWGWSRRRFPKDVRLGLFCSTLADQIQQDVSEDVAIRSAAAIAEDTELQSLENPTLQSPRMAQLLSEADIGVIKVSSAENKELLVARLRYLATKNFEKARKQRSVWGVWLPRAAMVFIGVGCAFFYIGWVLWPVYDQVAKW